MFVGGVSFFMHRVLPRSLSDDVLFKKVVEGLEKGLRVALAIVIDKKGSGPRGVGAKIVVYEDGSYYGTLGGGKFEHMVVNHCLEALKEGRPRVERYTFTGSKVKEGHDTGLICGGVLTVYIDVLQPPFRAIVVGVGRIGKPLADILNIIGFKVIVADPDPGIASKENFPYATEIITGKPEEIADKIVSISRKNDLLFIVHGEIDVDYTVLKKAITSPIKYIGLLGSRRKVIEFIKRLVMSGVSYDVLKKKLHAPIGIDIGAETPEEIAVSIVAEAISYVRGRYMKNYPLLNITDTTMVKDILNKLLK